MSQAQIKKLEARVGQLEDQLKAHQQQIVNTVAMQLQTFFTNPVMVDSLAHRLLIAGANAIAHKASHSTERAPELTVLEGYIPGALRAILNTDGSLSIEQQLRGSTNAGGEWESATATYEEKGVLESFAQLLSAFGAEAGRVYYITDTVTAQTHREKMAKELVAAGVTGADTAETPADADAIEFSLKLEQDFDTTSVQLFPKGTLVDTIRAGEIIGAIAVDEVQDEDVIVLLDGETPVSWIVVSSEEGYLPPTGEPADGPEPEADPAFASEGGEAGLDAGEPVDGFEGGELPPAGDDVATAGVGAFTEGTSVKVVTKPWSLAEEGQVELAGDELTQYVGPYTDYTVKAEAGEIIKEAHELQARDILILSRGGAVMQEVVVSAEVGEFTTEADSDEVAVAAE